MLNRDARTRRQAPPHEPHYGAVSVCVEGTAPASRFEWRELRRHEAVSTTKEEGDWPSTDGEENGMNSP